MNRLKYFDKFTLSFNKQLHYLTTDKEELKEKSEQLDRYHRISKYIFNIITII